MSPAAAHAALLAQRAARHLAAFLAATGTIVGAALWTVLP